MNLKSLMLAAGSITLLSSAAIAQVASQISAYKDTSSNTVWITGLQPATKYQVQNILLNGKLSAVNPMTNSCGEAGITRSDRYQKLSVNSAIFNVAALPQRQHTRCNPSHPNQNR